MLQAAHKCWPKSVWFSRQVAALPTLSAVTKTLLIASYLIAALLTASVSQAATATRTSAFAYDTSGQLIKEVIEPGDSNLNAKGPGSN